MMTSPALEFAARIVKRPPVRLSELETLVGALSVDFAGSEGMGHLWRDASSLPEGLLGLSVEAWFDVHHEDPRRPRDLGFRAVAYDFDATPAELARVVEPVWGTPRVIEHSGTWFEYPLGNRVARWIGADYGLLYVPMLATGTARLEWHHTRPEWASPRVPDDARRRLLTHLIAALMVSDVPKQIHARVRSELAAGGATFDTYADTVRVVFNPPLPLSVVLGAFGWEDPLAYSGDVHMSSWRVLAAEALQRDAREAVIGRWRVDVYLTDRPRDVPQRGWLGPSPLYELGSKPFAVASLDFNRRA